MGASQSYMYDPYWQQYFNNNGILGGVSAPIHDALQQYRWNRSYYGYPLNGGYNDLYSRQPMYLQQPYYSNPMQNQLLYQAASPYNNYYSPAPNYFY